TVSGMRGDKRGREATPKPLDKFGQFVMLNLRDPAIHEVDGLLKGTWKAPSLQRLQRSLAKLTPAQKKLVRRCVQECIDSATHAFLFSLQERADFENDMQLTVDGRNVVELSDGIHGEAHGREGWIARFSAYEGSPEE
ncbi:MAG: hypothetical protein ACAI25_11675, partial [Planctomycetota bacterium]